MITCTRCQHQNPDTAEACELCGARLARPSLPEEPVDLDWSIGESPDLFGIAEEKSAARRATGNFPGLGAPSPRATPRANPKPGPAGLAKLLQDALNTAPGGKSSPVAAAAAQVREDTFKGKAVSSATNAALPGARRISAPTPRSAPTVTEEKLSDFLLDALSQPADEEPRRRSTVISAPSTPAVSAAAAAAAPVAPAPAHSTQPGATPAAASSTSPDPRRPALVPPTRRPGAVPHAKSGAVTCATCGGANPEGMYYCVHCGASLEAEPGSVEGDVECAACGALNPADNRFCGTCGYPLATTGEAAPNWQEAIASTSGSQARHNAPFAVRLISINEDGSDGVVIPLDYRKTVIGRAGDTRFPTDAFLSPKHAALNIERDGVYIEDLYSLNGTFVKLRDEVVLTPGDIFLMGRQVLRFERFEQTITPKARSSDGTRYMGSPPPGGRFKLLQIGIGGVVQNVYCVPENGAVLGREQGEIIFPRDKFMSSRHAQLYPREEGKVCLVDLNSSNGTWIKIWEKTRVQNDDYIFLGQQLFRVEIDIIN